MTISLRVTIQYLIREYERLDALATEESKPINLQSRREGERDGVGTAIAVLVGAFDLPVGDRAGGVRSWLPALQEAARS